MKYKTFVDINPLFTSNPVTGDIALNIDTKAILFSIKNLVLTNYYERRFRSDLGSPVNQLLFDLDNSSQFSIVMRRVITDILTAHEPRVTITDIDIKADPDNNRVSIDIHVVVKNTLIPITASVMLERTR